MFEQATGSNTLICRSRGDRSATLVCRGTLPDRQLDLVARRLGEIVQPCDGPQSSVEVHATDEAAPAGAPSIADLLAHLAYVMRARDGVPGAERTAWLPALAWIAPHGPDPVALWGMDVDGAAEIGTGAGEG